MSHFAVKLITTLMALAPAAAHGASEWTLTTADFEKQRVELRELRGETLVVMSLGSERPTEVPLARFLKLERLDATPSAGDGLTLHLLDGGRLVGVPARVEGDSIIWKTASVGEVPASLRRAVGITRSGQALPQATEGSNKDRVQLVNGDVVEGILSDASAETLTVQVVGGDPIAVPLTSIAAMSFAAGVREEANREPGFQVLLTDGSVVRAGGMAVRDDALRFELEGSMREVPLRAVRSIEQVNGPVTWLSDLPPAQNEQRPFMGQPVPARFNQTLDGQPIVISGQRFGKGIAVHSYSRLVYDVSDGFAGFRARYAIEPAQEKANVTVRVLVDGKVVHEAANVTAGAIAPVVEADLQGAKVLTLEVDYGELYDVQDRLIWVEPALLR